jgi:hypothetical protein
VQVKRSGNVAVSGRVTYDANTQTATFDPSRNLAKATYQATINVNDNAGNMLSKQGGYTWQFSTERLR